MPTKSFLESTPPDDTGSDTLNRYRYQAQLVVPYCLECISNGTIISVFVEHFEDFVIEYDDQWFLIQVKTRNQNLGPWKLSDALDGIKSLWRTHKAMVANNIQNTKYALFLEGAIAKDDPLNGLAPSDKVEGVSVVLDPKLVNKVSEALKESEAFCKAFLLKITVNPNQATRQDIAARNIHLLGRITSSASFAEIKAGYEKLVNAILQAMTGDPLNDDLPVYITSPECPPITIKDKVIGKRLGRDTLKNLLGSLAYGSNLLLQRLVEPSMLRPTDLEMKLLAADADTTTITGLKLLRANASMREAEILSSSFECSQLDDVRIRLQVLANTVIQKHKGDSKPAITSNDELLKTLMDNAKDCDPNRVFKQDAFLLLGEVCLLADECLIDWGVSIA
jgi:hypothetical protein